MASSDPIFWINADEANPGRRGREITYRKDGTSGPWITERIPQRLPGYLRWMHVVKHDGNTVRVPLTNGASHVDAHTEFGAYQIAKANHFGWYRIDQCPINLILTKTIKRDTIVDQSILDDRPCDPEQCSEAKPCPHAIRERDARVKKNAAEWAAKMEGYKSDSDKYVEANAKSLERAVEGVGEVVANAMAAALSGAKGGGKKDHG